jgi:hypothetical protein
LLVRTTIIGSEVLKTVHVQQLVTDKNGFGKIPRGLTPDNSQIYLKSSTSKDNFVTETIWMGYPYETEAKKEIRTHFFTDRAIYRPGQTMYYKGIVLEKDGDKSAIKTKFPSTVSFTDVNGQEISKQELVTNEFGSFSGSFVVPQGVLAGYMQISDNNGSVGFQVEEYKRPGSRLLFLPLKVHTNWAKKYRLQAKPCRMPVARFLMQMSVIGWCATPGFL